MSSDDPVDGAGGSAAPPPRAALGPGFVPQEGPLTPSRGTPDEDDDRPVAALNPFQAQPRSQGVASSAALLITIGLHAGAAVALALNPGLAKKAVSWVEMTVAEPPPAEPPPPEPEAPKEKAKPKKKAPKSVAIEQTADQEAPDPQPDAPPEKQPLRRVQGLSASSFALGAGTGLAVRAGNTTSIAADGKGLDLSEASTFTTRPASAVAVQPKLTWQPPALVVPAEAQEARAQGAVEVRFDVDGTGAVVNLELLRDIGFGTGKACMDAWRRSTWKPGTHQGEPVTVTGVRKFCTVRIQG